MVTATVPVEVVSWLTKLVGADGSGRRVMEEPLTTGATVRSVLLGLSRRHAALHEALWQDGQLGEHIEVLVNDAVLGVTHDLDSPLRPGDHITLLGQYMGG
jgi:molybdopterin converting factor small subunit